MQKAMPSTVLSFRAIVRFISTVRKIKKKRVDHFKLWTLVLLGINCKSKSQLFFVLLFLLFVLLVLKVVRDLNLALSLRLSCLVKELFVIVC